MKILSGSGIEKLAAYFAGYETIDSDTMKLVLGNYENSLTEQDYSNELKAFIESSIPKKDEDSIGCDLASNIGDFVWHNADSNYRFYGLSKNMRLSEGKKASLLQYRQMLEAEVATGLKRIKATIEWRASQADATDKIATAIADTITNEKKEIRLNFPENFSEYEKAETIELIRSLPVFVTQEAAYEAIKWELGCMHNRDIETLSIITQHFGENLDKAAKEIVETSIREGIEDYKANGLKASLRALLDSFMKSDDCGIAKLEADGKWVVNADKAKEIAYRPHKRMGLNLEALAEGRAYTFGFENQGATKLDPYAISRQCIDDYTAFCFSLAKSEKEKKKIDAAKKVFNDEPNFVLEGHMAALSKSARQEIRAALGNKKPKNAYGSLSGKDKEKLEEIMMRELSVFLQSKPKSEKPKAFELVAEKWNPDKYIVHPEEKPNVKLEKILPFWGMEIEIVGKVYSEAAEQRQKNGLKYWGYSAMLGIYTGLLPLLLAFTLPLEIASQITNRKEIKEAKERRKELKEKKIKAPQLEIVVTRDARLIKEAAIATESSCIRHQDLQTFEINAKDPGTVHIVIKEDGNPKCYARAYIMETEKHEAVLGIDAIEPPKKAFKENPAMINAICLALVQLGLDMGAKYVVCNDARIKAGPKEAFGNTERRIKARKIGRIDVHQYLMRFNMDNDTFVLMQNWRK